MTTMRKRFYELATRALDDDARLAIVLAEIGASELPASTSECSTSASGSSR
jgi:hypothetical protein